MIAFLKGVLLEKSPSEAVVDVHGVGYLVSISATTSERLPATGSEAALLVHTHVREDAIQLFGFASDEERAVFRLLIGISGVGPKMALAILSAMSVAEFRDHVLRNNLVALTAISGVGRKTAERLVIELREKLMKIDVGIGAVADGASGARGEALLALTSLGYSRAVAEVAVRKALGDFGPNIPPVEQLVKAALRHANS